MLYNLYRPKDFSEVSGQEDVLLTLRRQSESGKFGHAYLLAGHRGTGKTTIARILAKAINCDRPTDNGPCGGCPACLEAQKSMDIRELDAATNNGVEHIMELTAQAKYRPVQLKNKVFIIDEVHNLSAAAFDVLLKPLEEPTSYCTYILCTTELHKIPVTIKSRCEVYRFHPIGPDAMRARLADVLKREGADCDADALSLIIRSANGGLRDALGLLEQLMMGTGGNITLDAAKKLLGTLDADAVLALARHTVELSTAETLNAAETLLNSGKSPSLITETLLEILMDAVTMKSTNDMHSVTHSGDYLSAVFHLCQNISCSRLYWLCEQLCELRGTIRGSTNPALDLRLSLIRLSSREIVSSDAKKLAAEVSMLKQELRELKEQYAAGRTQQASEWTSAGDTGVFPAEGMEWCQPTGKIPSGGICAPVEGICKEEEPEAPACALPPETEGGMPEDRTAADVSFSVSGATDSQSEGDLSASDLFSLLRA